MFKEELDFFISNQDALVKQYGGKVLVIRGREVAAAYDSTLEAYLEAQKQYPLGSFMLQRCEPGPQAYTVTIASRMILA